ncbi:MAG: hypothetical protein PHG25_00230 [Candidatus Pacebacteria bacterium]|nr:hypothetical protein [Candidatus Paceibacterota bacterium]
MVPSNKPIIKYAFINASLMSLYVIVIGSFFHFAPVIFGGQNKPDTVFIPIAMLLLFVFSATLSGTIVLGRPILWYLDGKKKEAVMLFSYTLSLLFVAMSLVFIVMALFR